MFGNLTPEETARLHAKMGAAWNDLTGVLDGRRDENGNLSDQDYEPYSGVAGDITEAYYETSPDGGKAWRGEQ